MVWSNIILQKVNLMFVELYCPIEKIREYILLYSLRRNEADLPIVYRFYQGREMFN